MDPNLNQITDLAAQQKGNSQSFLQGQAGQQSDFLNRFTGAINAQPTTSALASRIGNEVGLPQLQANATNLRNTLTNIPTTYSKAMTGFDVNANQLARITGQKSAELAPLVSTAENSLNNAQQTVNTRLGYETADQEKALRPFQTEQQLLGDRLAREASFYTTDNQKELDALVNKLQMGITLSEGEKNRAQQLAIAEKGYQNQLDVQKVQSQSNNQKPNTQIVESGGKKYLIDSGTGKIISTYGSGGGGGSNISTYYNMNTNSGPVNTTLGTTLQRTVGF